MRKVLTALMVASLGLVGIACDDAPDDRTKIDEDDRRVGPGDGVDEPGPGR